MSTTIRVSERTRSRFAQLSDATGQPMTQLLDDAVDLLERRLFFEQSAARWDQLRNDPAVVAEIDAERDVESSSASDRSR